MIRRPPRSTLFPYTTLFRSRILYFAPKEFWPADTGAKVRNYNLSREMAAYADVTYLAFSDRPDTPAAESDRRSEEHTSELQSHLNLVCRLLLGKKNRRVLDL